ncbi:hypothetical protein VKT23_010542 [Stygiomarasmius scandens]|uniref:Uncharacterized protein n=1 Tax=Marasmiellus scandens TaxID=2682957 RepID=A0ABR1JCJ7_9AGAR
MSSPQPGILARSRGSVTPLPPPLSSHRGRSPPSSVPSHQESNGWKEKQHKRKANGPASAPSKKARFTGSRATTAPPEASSSKLVPALPPPLISGNATANHGTFHAYVGPANWSNDSDECRSQLMAILAYLLSNTPQPDMPDLVELYDPERRLARLAFSVRSYADRFITYFNSASHKDLPRGYENLRVRRSP